jgi:hypothetical protein
VRRILEIALILVSLLTCGRLAAQTTGGFGRPPQSQPAMNLQNSAREAPQPGGFDVFIPISKYMAQGNADNLSAWFDDTLEIAVISQASNASKAQAKQIVKTFFENYSPRSFTINHTAGRDNMKYALGTLKAGGESFSVTIFVSAKGKSFKIQQLKIEQL